MERASSIRQVSVFGLIGNIFLLIIKLLIGFSTGSQAMIADGFNSSGDVFSSVMTYIGNSISSQPDDYDHPYGHGKAEYVFSFIISFSFLFVAYLTLKSGIENLLSTKRITFSIWLVAVALTTLIIKIGLYVYASRIGKKYNSLLCATNAEDHRNDLFITSLTLISIVCSYYQIFYVDAIVAILISLWIAYTGIKVLMASYHVLMDRALDEEILQAIKDEILKNKNVDHIDSVVATPIGVKFILLVKVSVDGEISVFAGHDICVAIKATLLKFDEISDVIVHLNPAQTHPQRNYLK